MQWLILSHQVSSLQMIRTPLHFSIFHLHFFLITEALSFPYFSPTVILTGCLYASAMAVCCLITSFKQLHLFLISQSSWFEILVSWTMRRNYHKIVYCKFATQKTHFYIASASYSQCSILDHSPLIINIICSQIKCVGCFTFFV